MHNPGTTADRDSIPRSTISRPPVDRPMGATTNPVRRHAGSGRRRGRAQPPRPSLEFRPVSLVAGPRRSAKPWIGFGIDAAGNRFEFTPKGRAPSKSGSVGTTSGGRLARSATTRPTRQWHLTVDRRAPSRPGGSGEEARCRRAPRPIGPAGLHPGLTSGPLFRRAERGRLKADKRQRQEAGTLSAPCGPGEAGVRRQSAGCAGAWCEGQPRQP